MKTYTTLPGPGIRKCYIDSADQGNDYLCAIAYQEIGTLKYILDVIYTQEPAEKTETLTANFLNINKVNKCRIESNSGGRAFGRNVERLSSELGNHRVMFEYFHQSKNKEARILSNSSTVCNTVVFPVDWQVKWPDFYDSVTNFIPGARGQHDDAEDALTGIVEVSGQSYIY